MWALSSKRRCVQPQLYVVAAILIDAKRYGGLGARAILGCAEAQSANAFSEVEHWPEGVVI